MFMHFYTKDDNNNSSKERLTILDTIKVDDHWRITFTKRIREFFPIKEGDIISVFNDNMSDHDKLIFKIQRDGILVDTLILKRNQIREKLKENNINNLINARSTSVLVIDDEEDLVLVLNARLTNEGYIVKSFNDSQKALYHLIEKTKTNSKSYDIIIIDVRMPIINGIQLYQILKILKSDSKVLFMTGLDAIDELSSLIPEIRPQDILKKPFGNEYLLQKIKEKLEVPLY
jgi:CheY-like chemotaxis protein